MKDKYIKNIIVTSFLFVTSFVMCMSIYSQSMPQQKKTGRIKSTITYCDLEVPGFWKRANSTFYLMYSVKIDNKGNVVSPNKIHDDVVGEEKVISCMSNWKILGIDSESTFTVLFKWQHGKGWIEQSISGRDFQYITRV